MFKDYMYIGEALQEINDLQGILTRLHQTRQRLFGLAEGTTPVKGFDDISDEVEQTLRTINDLKLRISRKNHKQSVTVVISEDKVVESSLMEAILQVGYYRSELAQLSAIDDEYSRYSMRYNRDEKGKYVPLSDGELELKIRELGRMKKLYDRAIQGVNWSVKL